MQIDQDLRSEVSTELREVQAKIAEFVERKVAAEDQLKRIDIRAPQDGIVHQSAVHTVGGVIGPGETLMLVMPEGDELSIEVKVAPQDIDQLRQGLDTSCGCRPSISARRRRSRGTSSALPLTS
jgi:HlyD family secretion protein